MSKEAQKLLRMSTASSDFSCFHVDSRQINRAGSFASFIQWMCQRSAYIVFAESILADDTPIEDYLRTIFGWVDCVTRSDVGYASGNHTTYYFIQCHAGQRVPLMNMLEGLHKFFDGCPVEDLAFFGADGLPRLTTITHEKIARLAITRKELQEVKASGEQWVRALHGCD